MKSNDRYDFRIPSFIVSTHILNDQKNESIISKANRYVPYILNYKLKNVDTFCLFPSRKKSMYLKTNVYLNIRTTKIISVQHDVTIEKWIFVIHFGLRVKDC